MTRISLVTGTLRGRILACFGAGLAVAGAGFATAAAAAGFSAPPAAASGATYNAIARAAGSTAKGQVAVVARRHGHGRPAARTGHQRPHAAPRTHQAHGPSGWGAVSKYVAARTVPRASHGKLLPVDRLTPIGTSGPQAYLPITIARYDNAKAIVRQAIARKMGLRAAVVAVATAMQESTLLNLPYGDSDSLGLFQQRPSAGWGTPRQILHPKYAADAFLTALHGYQARDPHWASQPLWQAAQGVQVSAYPYAYAKWEAEAANLVASVTKHLV